MSLALSLGKLYPEEIDGYFGPASLREPARTHVPSLQDPAPPRDLASLRREAQRLRAELDASHDPSVRMAKLRGRARAFDALLLIVDRAAAPVPDKAGSPIPFDSEAQRVYGIKGPPRANPHATDSLRALEKLLPGPGTVTARVAAFRARSAIPPDRRRAVFERALAECRARTQKKWQLPAGAKLSVEWTNSVDAAWHRYEGHAHSTLRLNPAAVAFVSAAVDVACHEGYPGHHAQFVVMEEHSGPGGLPVEDTVVVLRSPISMMREGAANYGVDLAFPPAERLAFERDVLFPLAGFDRVEASRYREVSRLVDELSASVAIIARDYRDGRLSADAARRALESSALVPSPEALLSFVDKLGPYVLGYTTARDRVRSYVEAEHRRTGNDRWAILRTVLEEGNVGPLGR